jgi:hypothetical protein
MEATVIMAACQKRKELFAIRTERRENGWWFTWAFRLNADKAKREGYDKTTVKGIINIDSEYPGCPHCEAQGFYQCGKCNKIACYSGQTEVTCPHCGHKGGVVEAESFDNIDTSAY